MTRFYIVRHGETEWNHHGNKYCGISDIRLNEMGRTQAAKAAASLRSVPVTAIYCSPLQRSRETASIIAVEHGLDPVVDERIREIDFGQWEGKTRKEIESFYPETWKSWLADPGITKAGLNGESGYDVWARLRSFFDEKHEVHQNQSIVIIGHNTSNRLYIAGSLGVPLSRYRRFVQHNAAISVLEYGAEELQWLHMNLNAHLTH